MALEQESRSRVDVPPTDREHLLRLAHQLSPDDEFADWLEQLVDGASPLSFKIVSSTAELAVLHEQVRAHPGPQTELQMNRPGSLLREQLVAYSHKLDAVRVAATGSDEAVPIFEKLLACGDARVVEAALLAMGSGLAKEFRTQLLVLAEREDEPSPIRQLAAILLAHGNPEV
jgi:hypothetical protein